jgi:FkbM family methyltransferase
MPEQKRMPKDLDLSWLKQQARDEESRQRIVEINERRNFVLKKNEFIKSRELFSINLGKYQLWFRESSAFSSIEVYSEIFKDDSHFLVAGFSSEGADLVVDIGANEGFYTLKVKEQNPRCKIICVEPNPYVFEMLEKNIESNNIRDVVLVNKAIGSSNGVITLEIIKEIGSIGGRDLRIAERPWLKDEFIERIEVYAVTLDALCRENNVSHIDILKIDVEGMETEILEASKDVLNRVHRIVVERHSKKLRNEVVTFLTDNHFALVLEEDPEFQRYYGDLYFINNRRWA